MASKYSKFNKVLLTISIMISVLFVSIIGIVTFLYNKYDLNIDKLTSLNNGVKVYSATGNDNTLYNTNRSIVSIEELPDYVLDAFIAIEDKNFYNHNGYDLKRIIKSSFVNLTTQSKSQGASTISQQLIKNALLSNEKTYSRKIQEIILSIKMEKIFSKQEILEMYLNTIYFGSNAYGIENASKIYFNKSAKDLTINEACCLAGLIKSPAYYSPKTHYENSLERKNLVAARMLKTKKITSGEFHEIKNMNITISKDYENDASYEKEAIFEACRLLNLNERELINKKYEIVTFKQDDLQKHVTASNKQIINSTEQNTNSTLDSLSIVANNNGHVLAYCANSNYNLHNLSRQPASTLKPLAVYLPCFEHNILSPASVILDEEINYNGFSPKNADSVYHGYVSTREALSHSLNIPAVKALDYLGVKKAKETLTNLGINISNSDLNLSLSLGAIKNGVNLLKLTSAYMALANQGYYADLCFVNKILDEQGTIVYSHENFKTQVASAEGCFLVNDILKDCAKTGTAKRLSSLTLPIASKTGTASISSGNTDLYNIAYTTEHTMLTWIADINNSTLPSKMLSSSQPTDINKLICEKLYENHSPADFKIPKNVGKCAYDLITLEEKHILAKPNHNIERYIAYDYFKTDNSPIYVENNSEINFDVTIDKTGVVLSFNAERYKKYNIYKSTTQSKELLDKISEKSGTIILKDNNVFTYNNIDYYITDEYENVIAETRIKPQDFLINFFNNEITSSKKKWLV